MGLCLFREGETDARIEKLGDYRKKFARVLFNEENLNQECSVFWIQMRAQQKGGFLEKADVLCCTQKFLDQIDAGEEATLAAIDRLVNIVFASEDLGNSTTSSGLRGVQNPEKITFEVFKTYIREMMLLLDLEMTKRLQQALVDRETLCLAPGVDYEQVTLPYRPHYCYHARDRERESFSNDVWVEERTTDHAEAGDTSFGTYRSLSLSQSQGTSSPGRTFRTDRSEVDAPAASTASGVMLNLAGGASAFGASSPSPSLGFQPGGGPPEQNLDPPLPGSGSRTSRESPIVVPKNHYGGGGGVLRTSPPGTAAIPSPAARQTSTNAPSAFQQLQNGAGPPTLSMMMHHSSSPHVNSPRSKRTRSSGPIAPQYSTGGLVDAKKTRLAQQVEQVLFEHGKTVRTQEHEAEDPAADVGVAPAAAVAAPPPPTGLVLQEAVAGSFEDGQPTSGAGWASLKLPAAASDSEARAIAEIRRLMGCILLVEEGKGDDQAAEEDYNDEEKQIQSDQQSQTAVLSLFQEIGSVSPVTVGVLRETKIGVFTQKYKTHASVEVQGLVRQLRQQWTEVVRRNASTHDTSASFGVTPRVGSSGELVPGGAVQRDAEPRRASSTTDAMKEKLTKTGVLLQVFHPEDSALEWTTLRVTRNSSTTPGGRPNQLQLSSGSSNMELNFDEIRSVEHSKDEPELILLTLKKDENNPLTLRFQDVQSAHVCCNSLRKFGLPVV
mmetsp:Transcript_253/g.408  ORF Transcript_253/g.408 Transcript_253/m.408 type:complete len:721 (+) Transcript_253:121-2283(+)|eukprot:CAMPEP_0178988124 /NCGR_PEP_ID=MMETSP0795-20121207/3641_1 /TAXON_ID=88552 /ORGANISM="Amoebophrya sp., Strain Ameob2" /LENGTH=720 /DNA_ID=CAMNT_0020679373 /DNA_START=36 /DNA_END=2198 /DNA_ORIENTATION=-